MESYNIPVEEVADYFINKLEPECEDCMSISKLQKLLYYAQGFVMAFTGKKLFNDPIYTCENFGFSKGDKKFLNHILKRKKIKMSYELLGILLTVVGQGLYVAFKLGKFEEKLNMLEKKQDKHNDLIERMVRVEDSTKSAHQRLDGLERK